MSDKINTVDDWNVDAIKEDVKSHSDLCQRYEAD